MVRQKQSHELRQEIQLALLLLYYVMCLTFYLKIFPLNEMYVFYKLLFYVFSFVSIVLTLTICFVKNIKKRQGVQTPISLLKNDAIAEFF